MQFSLKTLLVLFVGLAALLAQYPYVYSAGDPRHPIYGPTGRFTAVAIIEIILLMGWASARQGYFPWRPLLSVAALLLLSILLLALFGRHLSEAPEVLAKTSAMLLVIGGAVYIAYRAISRGQAIRPKQGPKP